MTNDELQRAIDDITTSDGGMAAPVTPVMSGDANEENEQLAGEFGGATAAPAMTPAEAVAAELNDQPVTSPVMPADSIAAEPVVENIVDEAPVVAEVAPAVTPEVVPEEASAPAFEMPATEEVKGDVDLEEVKKNALRELYPLLKNMNINPEQAFAICKEVAEMGEKGAFQEAFEAARKISDDAKRAEALFSIVEMIEK